MTPQNINGSLARTVIHFLGIIGVAIVAGAVYLVATKKPVPDPLWALAGSVTGALGGVLAHIYVVPDPPSKDTTP